MLRLFNLFLVIGVLVSAFLLYSLEHRMRGGEREVARIERAIAGEREQMRLLQAEWASLAQPARIERLAREHAKMRPTEPLQFASEAELAQRLPERPAPNPAESPDDPLAQMLRDLQ
ncbi:MAG: cell division protein FtsL [Parvibaculaceae bacterium]